MSTLARARSRRAGSVLDGPERLTKERLEDRALRARIHREVIEPSLTDNTRARDLLPDGTYVRRSPVRASRSVMRS